jgi:hypothetical protein
LEIQIHGASDSGRKLNSLRSLLLSFFLNLKSRENGNVTLKIIKKHSLKPRFRSENRQNFEPSLWRIEIHSSFSFQGIDVCHKWDRKVRRTAPKSQDVYLRLLVKVS